MEPGNFVPALPHDLWMMDFVFDQLDTVRRLRVLAIYDVCTCQCLVAIADFSLTGKRMAEETRSSRGANQRSSSRINALSNLMPFDTMRNAIG